MKKIAINSLKYLLFLAIGIFIFWFIYRKIEWEELVEALVDLKYFWLIVSVACGLLSQLSRSVRWKMLIKPLGKNPSLSNTFLSVLVLYFVNLILPRAGEVARCTVLSRTDKIPFTKLVGTVFIERLADTIMLFLLAIIIFASNFNIVVKFFNEHPALLKNLNNLLAVKNILFLSAAIALLFALFIIIRKRLKKSSKKGKLIEFKNHLIEGVKSIAHMKNKWLFIGHTLFIFLMWLIMLYVVFLSYEPTQHLSIRTGMVVFLMGGLAMLAPIQGGIGPWHFMVIETLLLYDITKEAGSIFALIAHTATNLIYIIFGGIAIIILTLKYGNKAIRFKPVEKTGQPDEK